MSVDDEKVKDALDDFEDEKFSDAKEKIAGEIKKARDDFLKAKLQLQKDLEDREEKEEDAQDDAEGEDEDSDEEEEESDDDKKKERKKRISKAIKKKQEEE